MGSVFQMVLPRTDPVDRPIDDRDDENHGRDASLLARGEIQIGDNEIDRYANTAKRKYMSSDGNKYMSSDGNNERLPG